ncbi:MAG: helix-turn-helix domain-containing protein [Niabella sp.]|nr:helix-turn-helix domain-containing protein [Niabella sp.]
MKIIYENFSFPPDQSFTVRSECLEIKKYQEFRSHPNFEIAFHENCTGSRLVGKHIEAFSGTELVLMGSHLPHCWQYHGVIDPMQPPQVVVVHFFPDFLGKDFLEKPEARALAGLFGDAAQGVLFTGEILDEARFILQAMLLEKELGRATWMLRLLDLLSRSGAGKVLNPAGFNMNKSPVEASNMNTIFEYIFKNFRRSISLEEVAAIIPMSASAFCRFFKSKTGRTLSDFIKEVRIGHATKLLLEGNYNVSETCYNSGYNNISNFNKHFKELEGVSPKQFRERYLIAG